MKQLALLLALVFCLSACTAAPAVPPESILYLGGAPILERFTVDGGPGAGVNGTDLDIVLLIPPNYESEGFHAVCIGYYEDGTQKTIFTEADLTPESYYVINKETYKDFTRLSLCLDYTWNGTLMSMRVIDLLTLEEHSSVITEFGTTVPQETTIPIETTLPTVPETTVPSVITDFTPYEAMLSFSAEPNWLARALGVLFESPADVDLEYMFYLGVDHPGSWGDISAESRQTLLDLGFWEEMDIQIMPAEKLESALQSTFGVTLADVTIPEYWGYIEAEDAWCSNHNDAYFPGVPVITAVEDDGRFITIHYTIDFYWIPGTDEFLDTAPLVLSLIRSDDGTICAVSNLLES